MTGRRGMTRRIPAQGSVHGWACLPACLLVCLLAVALLSAPASAGQSLPRLDSAADLERVVRDGGATVTVVNYWATWCPPCREELPVFMRLQQGYGARGVRVIGVSFDYDPRTLERFLGRASLGYVNYIGDGDLMDELGVGVIPTTVIYGPQGERVSMHQGGVTADMLLERITPMLENGDEDAH